MFLQFSPDEGIKIVSVKVRFRSLGEVFLHFRKRAIDGLVSLFVEQARFADQCH